MLVPRAALEEPTGTRCPPRTAVQVRQPAVEDWSLRAEPISSGGGSLVGGAAGASSLGGSAGESNLTLYEEYCTDFTKCASTEVLDDFARSQDDIIVQIPNTFDNEGYWYSWGDTGVTLDPSNIEDAIVAGKLAFTATNTQDTSGAALGVILNLNGEVSCPADASHHDGIEIVGKTLEDSAERYRVLLFMPEVIPTEDGGTCIGDGCWAAQEAAVEFPASSSTIQIPFTDFEQPSWGDPPVEFDASKITRIEIHPLKMHSTGFSVELDSIGFYGTGTCDGDSGTGGMGGSGKLSRTPPHANPRPCRPWVPGSARLVLALPAPPLRPSGQLWEGLTYWESFWLVARGSAFGRSRGIAPSRRCRLAATIGWSISP